MKFFKKIASLVLCTLLILPLNIAYGSTGSYFIDAVDIDATLNEDGTINVIESQEYRFNGEFNGVFRDFLISGNADYEIDDVSIIDENNNRIKAEMNSSGNNNSYEIYEENGKLRVKVYSKSKNESKKLIISYKLKNSDLYLNEDSLPVLNWNFYSVENVDSIKRATLTLGMQNYSLSDNNTRYNTYGDGTLDTYYENGKIYVSYDNLTSILAIKATLPTNFFTTNLPTESYSDISYNLDNNVVTNNKSNSTIAVAIISFLILIGIIILLIVKYIKGEKKKFEEALELYRSECIFDNISVCDIPPSNMAPALVNILINAGKLDKNMITPSLLYLVSRGYYNLSEKFVNSSKLLERKEKDLIFKRNLSLSNPKEKHLRYLIDWFHIYSEDNEFSLMSIKKKLTSTSKAQEFMKKQQRWEEIVKEDATSINMFHIVYNKEVISNEFINEKNSWHEYKSYISQVLSSNTIELDSLDINDLLLYAPALNIYSNSIEKFCDILKAESSKYKVDNYYSEYNNYHYMYSYYPLFSMYMGQIHNNSVNHGTTPTESGGGFTGGFGGGGFSGGGGGGGGAF